MLNEFEEYRILAPPLFEEVLTHFYFSQNTSGEHQKKMLMPTFQTMMVFSFGKGIILQVGDEAMVMENCLVLGPVKQILHYEMPPSSEILVANFKGDAFYRFFGKISAMSYLDPKALVPENCFTHLRNSIEKLTSIKDRVDHILEFCKPYLKHQDPDLKRLMEAFDHRALNPIKQIADETKQSERNLQLKHQKQLGYSAKEFFRYKRFLESIEWIEKRCESTTAVDWQEVVVVCGYYDQSQLIRDFQHYLKLSPKQYVRLQQRICR